jgi:hypothetical protein
MVVAAVEVKILDEKAVFLEGKLEALKLFADPRHTSVELVADVGAVVVGHNWDIEVLALALVVPACVAGDHGDVVAYQVAADCR